MLHHRPVLLAAALLLAALPLPLDAQLNLQVVPKIGVYTPLAPLGDGAELESTMALGVAGELTFAALPVGLRVGLDHATTTEVRRRDATEAVIGEARITAVAASLVVRPFDPAAPFQPYFMAGGGAKRLDLDLEAVIPDLAAVRGRTTRPTLHVGGGVDVRFGPVSLLLEVANYISSLEARPGQSRVQHDAFGLLGFRVNMF
jgi:hypothetical protein